MLALVSMGAPLCRQRRLLTGCSDAGHRSGRLPSVDPVEYAGDLGQTLRLGVKTGSVGKPYRPVGGGAPTPIVGRGSQELARRSPEELGGEIVERAVHVAQRGSALRAVERGGNDCVASGLKLPRAGELHRCARFELQGCDGIVRHAPRAVAQGRAAGEKPARNLLHLWEVEAPQGQVDEMNAKIHYAAAAG